MVASRKVKRATRFARELGYSAMKNSKRQQRTEFYDGATYKAEKDGRKAIEFSRGIGIAVRVMQSLVDTPPVKG